jgi:ribosomal-protein-serine acetyltransferase
MDATDLPTPAPWTPPSPLPVARRTERTVLRYFVPEDAERFLAALNVERHTYLPWLPWVSNDNRSIAEAIFNFERFRRERERAAPTPDNFVIGIFDGGTGDVIGGTGLHRVVHAHHEAEIGYWVRADRRRQGLCAEATAGMISWGLAAQSEGGWGFHRVFIRVAGTNESSQRVPRKLGLNQDGRLRGDRWVPSVGWDDTLVWSVLAEEWDTTADCLRRA